MHPKHSFLPLTLVHPGPRYLLCHAVGCILFYLVHLFLSAALGLLAFAIPYPVSVQSSWLAARINIHTFLPLLRSFVLRSFEPFKSQIGTRSPTAELNPGCRPLMELD